VTVYRYGLIAVVLLSASMAFAQTEQNSEAQTLLERLDHTMFPTTYEMTLTMTTHRPGQDDLYYKFDVIGSGVDKSLMTMTDPARERGKQILMNGDNLWLYIPDVSRPVKLTKRDRFMGSTFSNDDVMSSTLADKYNASILSRRMDNGHEYATLDLEAKSRDVSYAKLVAVVDSATAIPDTITYYGLAGEPIKYMVTGEVKHLAGRMRPTLMTMYDNLEQGAYTAVNVLSLEAKKDIPESMFDPTRLGK
jgi:outer membrane lipoprotein-sorting protein